MVTVLGFRIGGRFTVVLFVIVFFEWNVKADQTIVHSLLDGNNQFIVLLLAYTGF